ncbi:uncharacterized protein PHACADRAFT_246408 [Phanerochaete carnosa HHB-10118-sp]|uniref:Uncharacterized protein n=1 Tax=Phanerochaete carnosa (strain HHB-10118-sp) TaxID=650164 RepID=K5WMN6_PHACS|nr:uncharacterized protein PHACADRAFT_246408 [Phanerochaete carnosa HHB-10118-sp]EKM60454.1 hypothetical protein PHACADRAFT_246408 [Phanerochaete carnosa HHB-10118-sp]
MPVDARYHMSPEAMRMRAQPPPPPYAGSSRPSESPRMTSVATPSDAKSRGGRRKAQGATPEAEMPGMPQEKKERKRRQRRGKEDTPAPMQPPRQDSQYGMPYRPLKTSNNGSPEPSSNGSNGSGPGSASRSTQPSPTSSAANPAHHPPTRIVDEDYDGDGAAAEVLMNMSNSSYRSGPSDPRNFGAPISGPMRSPPDSRGGPPPQMSPHSMAKHPAMQRNSPPSKRPLSPGPEDPNVEPKRSRVGSTSRRMSSPSAQAPSSTRPSPVPFRHQPTTHASHSPEMRQDVQRQPFDSPPSPALPTTLPPHPRPIGSMGAGFAAGHTSGPGMPLPPSLSSGAVRSPPGMSPTDSDHRMHDSRSNSPNAQRMPAKREIVVHAARSPPGSKGLPSPASSHGSHASHGSGGSHKMVVS